MFPRNTYKGDKHFREISSQDDQTTIQPVQVVQTRVLVTFSSLRQIPDSFGIVAGGLRTVFFEIQPDTGERSTLLLGLVAKLIEKN